MPVWFKSMGQVCLVCAQGSPSISLSIPPFLSLILSLSGSLSPVATSSNASQLSYWSGQFHPTLWVGWTKPNWLARDTGPLKIQFSLQKGHRAWLKGGKYKNLIWTSGSIYFLQFKVISHNTDILIPMSYSDFSFQMIQNYWVRELWLISILKIPTNNFNIRVVFITLRERTINRARRLVTERIRH